MPGSSGVDYWPSQAFPKHSGLAFVLFHFLQLRIQQVQYALAEQEKKNNKIPNAMTILKQAIEICHFN